MVTRITVTDKLAFTPVPAAETARVADRACRDLIT
jgi:hypothetical protein